MKIKAEIDSLTGVYNRHAFETLFKEVMEDRRDNYLQKVLCILDLDQFKLINDQFGHQQGDQILQQFAGILQKNSRKSDLVGRLGGDEFLILYTRVYDATLLEGKISSLIEDVRTIRRPDEGFLTCSIGMTVAAKEGDSFEEMYKRADRALYEAKEKGKNQFSFT